MLPPLEVYTDNRSVIDSLKMVGNPSDKAIYATIAFLKETNENNNIMIRLIPGSDNPADDLTKATTLPNITQMLEVLSFDTMLFPF